jgi:glutamine cyclotransferase
VFQVPLHGQEKFYFTCIKWPLVFKVSLHGQDKFYFTCIKWPLVFKVSVKKPYKTSGHLIQVK